MDVCDRDCDCTELCDAAWEASLNSADNLQWLERLHATVPLEAQERAKDAGRRLVLKTARQMYEERGLELPPLVKQTHEWAHRVLRSIG